MIPKKPVKNDPSTCKRIIVEFTLIFSKSEGWVKCSFHPFPGFRYENMITRLIIIDYMPCEHDLYKIKSQGLPQRNLLGECTEHWIIPENLRKQILILQLLNIIERIFHNIIQFRSWLPDRKLLEPLSLLLVMQSFRVGQNREIHHFSTFVPDNFNGACVLVEEVNSLVLERFAFLRVQELCLSKHLFRDSLYFIVLVINTFAKIDEAEHQIGEEGRNPTHHHIIIRGFHHLVLHSHYFFLQNSYCFISRIKIQSTPA